MNAKTRIVNKLCAIMIIVAMMVTNFWVVGETAVSYAIDMLKTSNANVELSAYFVDDNGAEIVSKDRSIADGAETLYVKIGVRNEGYFNGKITLENSNFVIDKNYLSDGVQEITETGEASLKQINAGTEEIIKLKVNPVNKPILSLSELVGKTSIKLEGEYTNSKNVQKDKTEKVEGFADVTLNWVLPEESNLELSGKVFTNKKYEIDGEEKQIVQLLVKSKIKESNYPIKASEIHISKLEGTEKVIVDGRNLEEKNKKISYQDDTDIVVIINNIDDDKLVLDEDGEEFIVTYILGKEVDTINKTIKVSANVELYEEKDLESEIEVGTEEEKEGIITYEIDSDKLLYKGKIRTGEGKEYKENVKINVNYEDLAEEIELTEEKSKYKSGEEVEESNIIYKQTKIKKSDFIKIFGEDGYLNFVDENGITVANVNSSREADEDGNIVIKYLGDTKKVQIEGSKPVEKGTLIIENIKEIKKDDKTTEEINDLTEIEEKITSKTGEIVSKIELENTNSEAKLEVSTDTLSTLETNQNVKMVVTLLNNDETRDLYKNPTVRIELPKQVKDVKINSSIMYGNGLSIESSNVIKQDGKSVIEVKLTGTQTSYNADAVEGTTIIIYADMDLEEFAPNSDEKFILTYTNELATTFKDEGKEKVPVKIKSLTGVITTNSIDELGVSTVGSNETKEVKLDISKAEKDANVKTKIINNEETKINNVKILGTFPTKSSDNLGITLKSGIGNIENAKVYYSDKENPTDNEQDASNNWKEELDIKNAKSYLIVVDELEKGEKIEANYTINIPANLDYDMKADMEYKVSYSNNSTNEQETIEGTKINLTTGNGPSLDMSIEATVGSNVVGEGKDNQETVGENVTVKEIIKYEVKLTNNGTAPATSISVKENVSKSAEALEYTKKKVVEGNGQGQVGSPMYDFEIIENDGTVVKTIEKIDVGESKTIDFYLRPEEITEEKLINEIEVNYNEKTSKKYVTNSVVDSGISAVLNASNPESDKDYIVGGEEYVYTLLLENLTEKEIKNIDVEIKTNDLLDITKLVYINDDANIENEDSIKEVTDTNKIQIENISEYSSVNIYVKPKETATSEKTAELSAIVTYSGNKVRTNQITKQVKTIDVNVNIEANNVGEEVLTGKEINYTIKIQNSKDSIDLKNVEINDSIFKDLDIIEVSVDGKVLDDKQYLYYSKVNEQGEVDPDSTEKILSVTTDLNAGTEKVIVIKTKIKDSADIGLKTQIEIINSVNLVYGERNIAQSGEVIHILKPDENKYKEQYSEKDYPEKQPENPDTPEDPNEPGTQDPEDNPNNPSNPETKTYTISGTVWFDENENGGRENDEQKLGGIKLKLLNLDNNEIINTATTSENGVYSFTNVPNGKYVVIFEFDTEKYMLTTYRAKDISDTLNSDVENVTMKIDGSDEQVYSTDTLEVKDNSISNIDLGLMTAKVFDLELTKTISKVTVTNKQGTKTANYDGATFAKTEIDTKYLEGSTIVVEYKIKVTNTGEIAGYAKSIVDYKPADLKFDSSLNKGWYQSGTNLYSNSFANTKIEPKETKELTLVLSKTMTENNIGLVNNLAEIAEDYNALGISDKDSIPGNKQKEEDDLGTSNLSIGIKTGSMISYMTFTISILTILLAGAYLVSRKMPKGKKIENIMGGRSKL